MATKKNQSPRRTRLTCPRCGGHCQISRTGDFFRQSCTTCGHSEEIYRPRGLAYRINMPPQPAETPESRRAPIRRTKEAAPPKPEIPEPELFRLIQRYCELRQRGHTHEAMRTQYD